MPRGPLGDIRNFPRKESLTEDIIDLVENRELNHLIELSTIPPEENILVEKIVIYGSWGRGTATPFVSDVDILVLADGRNESGPFVPPFDISTRYVLFREEDIFVYFNEEEFEEELTRFIRQKEPHIAYDIANRENIRR